MRFLYKVLLGFFSSIFFVASAFAETSTSEKIWDLMARSQVPKESVAKEAKTALLSVYKNPVKLEGWVIPNEYQKGELKTFLLTRFPGGCIHVPLPPPYYVVQVKMKDSAADKLKDLVSTMEVSVEGVLAPGSRVDASFSLEATSAKLK